MSLDSVVGSFVCYGGDRVRFVVDSGTTNHMVNSLDALEFYEELLSPLYVEVGNGERIKAYSRESMSIWCVVTSAS